MITNIIGSAQINAVASSLSTSVRWHRFGERPAGLSRRGNQKEVSGATKPYGEASITTSIEPGVVFCRRDKGDPIWPTNRRHHLVEDSLRELLQLMFGKTKSALTK